MARPISSTLLSTQQGTQRKPYKKVVINSVDYSSRVLFVEHHEEPYRDYATIILNNKDRGLDSVATLASNLLGYRFRIGHGFVTNDAGSTWTASTSYAVGDSVVASSIRYYCIIAGLSDATNEPSWPTVGNTVVDGTVTWEYGCVSANEYSSSADLWVKSQQMISSPGQLVCQLYCEGQWMYAREQKIIATSDPPSSIGLVDEADIPYTAPVFNGTHTVYQLVELIIEGVFGWTLNAAPSTDDGILTTFKPVFSFAEWPDAASALYELVKMTKCYLRPKANRVWEFVYPQSSDTVNETYYSGQTPYFYEYAETLNLLIPNKIVVFAGNPDNLPVWPIPVIVGETADYTGNYVQVMEPHLAPSLTTLSDANNRADSILTRYKAEQLGGYLIVPHDARVELYDRVEANDQRGH